MPKHIAPRSIYGRDGNGRRVLVAASGDVIPNGFDLELEAGEKVADFPVAAEVSDDGVGTPKSRTVTSGTRKTPEAPALTDPPAGDGTPSDPDKPDYSGLNRGQLDELLAERNIDVPGDVRKNADKVKLLEADDAAKASDAEGNAEGGPADETPSAIDEEQLAHLDIEQIKKFLDDREISYEDDAGEEDLAELVLKFAEEASEDELRQLVSDTLEAIAADGGEASDQE